MQRKLPEGLKEELHVEHLKRDFAKWWLATLQVYSNAIMKQLDVPTSTEQSSKDILAYLKQEYQREEHDGIDEKTKKFVRVEHHVLPVLYDTLNKHFGWDADKQKLFEHFRESHTYRPISLMVKQALTQADPEWAKRYTGGDKDLSMTIFATAAAIAIHHGREGQTASLAKDLGVIANWMLNKIVEQLGMAVKFSPKVVGSEDGDLAKLSDDHILPFAKGCYAQFYGNRESKQGCPVDHAAASEQKVTPKV